MGVTTFETRYDEAVRKWISAQFDPPIDIEKIRGVMFEAQEGRAWSEITIESPTSEITFEVLRRNPRTYRDEWVRSTIEIDGKSVGTFIAEVCEGLK